MLRIYDCCLEMVRGVRPVAEVVARRDADHARQLRRSALSVVLNVAEGAGNRGGNRRLRYQTAMGSALETVANLEAAEAIGYVGPLDAGLRDRLDRIVRTLAKLSR